MGKPRKLSKRGMRSFKKYVLNNCFEPLYVIVSRFNIITGLEINESIAKRYMKKMKMYAFIAVHKPYLSKNNMSARIVWARTHEFGAQESGRK